jgi:hypothetical protein
MLKETALKAAKELRKAEAKEKKTAERLKERSAGMLAAIKKLERKITRTQARTASSKDPAPARRSSGAKKTARAARGRAKR